MLARAQAHGSRGITGPKVPHGRQSQRSVTPLGFMDLGAAFPARLISCSMPLRRNPLPVCLSAIFATRSMSGTDGCDSRQGRWPPGHGCSFSRLRGGGSVIPQPSTRALEPPDSRLRRSLPDGCPRHWPNALFAAHLLFGMEATHTGLRQSATHRERIACTIRRDWKLGQPVFPTPTERVPGATARRAGYGRGCRSGRSCRQCSRI